MKKSEFDNILDECLERLIKGETVEQCLEGYPEQAGELEPLLRTAQVAKEASAITPRADFKARARYEFHAALHAEISKEPRPRFALRRGWMVAFVIVSILLVSGGGTALAASNSMPDSPLYPVKLATERIELALTPSATAKAELCATFADRRVIEIIYLAAKGDTQEVEATIQRLDEGLAALVVLVSPEGVETTPVEEAPAMLTEEPAMAPLAPAPAAPEGQAEDTRAAAAEDSNAKLKMAIATYAASHGDALHTALDKAPAGVKSALRHAISVSEAGYSKALAAMD